MEAAGFVYQRRRLWNEKDSNPSVMINDVRWEKDEDMEEEFTALD